MKSAILAIILVLTLSGFCAGADEPTIYGTYISKSDSKEYLTLYPDGAFLLKQRKKPPDLENPFVEITGKYSISGEELKLKLADGGEASGKLTGNTFMDSDEIAWVKQGSEKFQLKRPKTPKPGEYLPRF